MLGGFPTCIEWRVCCVLMDAHCRRTCARPIQRVKIELFRSSRLSQIAVCGPAFGNN